MWELVRMEVLDCNPVVPTDQAVTFMRVPKR